MGFGLPLVGYLLPVAFQLTFLFTCMEEHEIGCNYKFAFQLFHAFYPDSCGGDPLSLVDVLLSIMSLIVAIVILLAAKSGGWPRG